MKGRRTFTTIATTLTLAISGITYAADDDPVKIGLMTDITGFLSSSAGPSAVDAARMAVEDFGGEVLGKKIEFVYADHMSKPDVGLAAARKWYESDDVDIIVDIGNSAVGLGVQELSRNKKKLLIIVGASSSAFTDKACSPYSMQWSQDTYMFGTSLPAKLTRDGDKNWYFITADFAFGQTLQVDATKAITQAGGTVSGSVKHPPNSTDFSSYLLQASASKANVVALANAVTDTTNSIKQWREFQMGGKNQKLVALTLLLHDVRALGLPVAQDTIFSTIFYWDLNEKTRAFSQRFYARNQAMPAEVHAGNYSAVLHYLKAVQAAGTKDADIVRKKMMELPINDFYSDNVRIREDGRVMRKSYIAQVKKPAESTGEWDLYKILEAVPAEQSWRPLAESQCPLVGKQS